MLLVENLGGFSREKSGKYLGCYLKREEATAVQQVRRMEPDMTFEVAGALYGKDSDEQMAAHTGWGNQLVSTQNYLHAQGR